MRITVLGAGSWGTTLSILLWNNSHKVTLWCYEEDLAREMNQKRENTLFLPGTTIPKEIEITSVLEQAVSKNDLLVCAVPSQFIRQVLTKICKHDFRETLIVNVAKGIENESLMTISEIILDVLPTVRREKIVTLSGPSFAEEVAHRIPTAVVASSISLESAKIAQEVFFTPYFRVYSSTDIKGVELGGSMKNVIAIGTGIADGAGYGDNTKAAIITRATVEISRLGTAMGANPKTFAGLSGIGDLIATCISKHSRNRHVGEEIGKGRKLNDVLSEMVMVAEGVPTTKSLYQLAKKYQIELPIVNEVYQVLFEDKDPIQAASDLMMRDAKIEM